MKSQFDLYTNKKLEKKNKIYLNKSEILKTSIIQDLPYYVMHFDERRLYTIHMLMH